MPTNAIPKTPSPPYKNNVRFIGFVEVRGLAPPITERSPEKYLFMHDLFVRTAMRPLPYIFYTKALG